MPIEYTEHCTILSGAVTVEEADPLLAWLFAHPQGQVDLQAVSHLHTAVLQVLLSGGPRVVQPPLDPFLATWIAPLLRSGNGNENSHC